MTNRDSSCHYSNPLILFPDDTDAEASGVDFFICSKSEQNLLHRKQRSFARMLWCEFNTSLVCSVDVHSVMFQSSTHIYV